jgi:formate hydrogenlyase subunit 4
MNQASGIAFQVLQSVLVVAIAPLMLGWVNQCRAWMQNRSGPGIWQPYRVLNKLFHKDAVVAHDASPLFRATPYILFGCMWLAVGIVPVLGTSFGTLGARREMMIGFLAEPAMLMTLFTASLISHSTSLVTIVQTLGQREFVIYPSMAFAAIAFLMVLLAENARIPIDNPSTHLELTMIHEAMILEYSARHLALIEWASSLKLTAYVTIGIAMFAPWGIAAGGDWTGVPIALGALAVKLALAGFGLALLETVSAKMRIFRAPEFLATAFLLATLGMLTHFLLEN